MEMEDFSPFAKIMLIVVIAVAILAIIISLAIIDWGVLHGCTQIN